MFERGPVIFMRLPLLVVLLMSVIAATACTLPGAAGDAGEQIIGFDGPPTVRIASPADNAAYMQGTTVNILARIDNAGPDMARIVVQVNDIIIGDQDISAQAGAPAFSISQGWPATQPGDYTVSVTASRAEGESQTTSVNIQVVAAEAFAEDDATDEDEDPAPVEDPAETPEPQQPPALPSPPTQATNTPAPTNTAAPTAVPASPTPSRPTVRVESGANIRSGPGTIFNPPIGSLAAGTETDLLARNPAGDWYKIRYFNGEGWIAASLVQTQGDLSNLPVDAGPPTPAPTNTPEPTPVPRNVDLAITNSNTNPFPLICNQASRIVVTVANAGSNTSEPTTVVVEDLFNGNIIESTSAPIGALAPGENVTVELFLTVTTNIFEGHVHRIRVDPNNVNQDSNPGNNVQQFDYVLQPGSC